jgi:hypothetical protein
VKLVIGQAVMFGEPNGSFGRVTSVSEGRCYVKWSYGLDAYGEQVSAYSGLDPCVLMKIDESLLKQYEATRFNSEDRVRTSLRDRILESRARI